MQHNIINCIFLNFIMRSIFTYKNDNNYYIGTDFSVAIQQISIKNLSI